MRKLNCLYFGTPDFSLPSLELLHNHPEINLIGVVTMPDRPAGRGKQLKSPPVADFAKDNKIRLYQTENINKEPEILAELEKSNIDIFIVLAFAQFLGKRVLNIPKMGCFNIHTSILPKYRGAAPIQYALMNGDKKTGVSIQRMVKKMDAGDLVKFDELQIGDNETGGQLYTRLKSLAPLTLNNLIQDILDNSISYTPQDEESVTFAPTLKKEDGLIDFKNRTSKEIHNLVRALKPWPGTYCYFDKKRVKILEVEISPLSQFKAGELSLDMNSLIIGTKDTPVHLKTIQLEGKKMCSDTEFINGLKSKGQSLDKNNLTINPEV